MARTLSMTKLSILLVALLAALSLAAKTKCAKGAHIIAVRGHPPPGSNSPAPDQGYGITKPLLEAIKAAIPHSTNQSISYPKDDTVNQENQIAVKKIQQAVASSVKKCPKTPVITYGYSNGALILMNAVCGTSSAFLTATDPLNAKYSKNVIGTIVYSDGSYSPNQPWDKSSCQRSGTFPRMNNDACSPFAAGIQSYCDKDDGYCCAFGQDHSSHYTYFKKYDKKVGQFLAKKFKAFKKKN